MEASVLLKEVVFLIFLIATGLSKKQKGQKVILFLTDAMRWDRYRVHVPHLDDVEKNGVRADWLDGVFLTVTLPSTYSIATGLYPESHGVVSNVYFNQTTKERTNDVVDTLNVTEWFDTGVEPIWVTAKNAGKTVGSIMYVAAWLPINGVEIDRAVPLTLNTWANYALEDRLRDTVNWISDDDFDLVLTYVSYPDTVLHSHRLEDEASTTAVKDIDQQIGYLFQLIEEKELSDEVNVIIVSDHGFTNVEDRKFIRLYDYINESDVDFMLEYGVTLFQLAPVEGKLEEVYQALKFAHPAMHVYKKEEFPERLHFARHPRNLPIIGFVDPEWHVHTEWDPSTDRVAGGNHGYDNRWMLMKSSFYAQGPFFKKGYRARPLESVDIYGMICEILDINPAPNNGSRDRYSDMIRSGGAILYPNMSVVSIVFFLYNVIQPYV